MNSLYVITNNFVELMNKAAEGEITEEEYNKLGEELALELQNKSANIIAYMMNEERFIEAVKTEEKRLKEMREKTENRMERFKQYVKDNMEKLNLAEVPTELGCLKIAKNPISVEIVNEDEIPGDYKKEVIETKVDKTAIKEHFKTTGEIIPGARIIDNKTSLRIK